MPPCSGSQQAFICGLSRRQGTRFRNIQCQLQNPWDIRLLVRVTGSSIHCYASRCSKSLRASIVEPFFWLVCIYGTYAYKGMHQREGRRTHPIPAIGQAPQRQKPRARVHRHNPHLLILAGKIPVRVCPFSSRPTAKPGREVISPAHARAILHPGMSLHQISYMSRKHFPSCP